MSYDIDVDPYINPNTGVLRNKLGAKTQSQLDHAEAEITYIAIATLTFGSRPDKLVFNTELLLDVHKEIFRDIYSWAGQIRTHDISKGASYFTHAQYIRQSLDSLLSDIKSDEKLDSSDMNEFIERIAYYYGELNAIHPFREGNGRAIRTFLRLLALSRGYDIEWAKMDGEENIAASSESIKGNSQRMHAMIAALVAPLEYR